MFRHFGFAFKEKILYINAMEKYIEFNDEKILLECVAEKEDAKLYRMPSNDYINGATYSEIKEVFEDFHKTIEDTAYTFFLEKNGKLIVKNPDE